MKNKIFLNSAIILIGLVFLASGVTKGIDIDGFAVILRGFGAEWFYFLAPFISAAEIFLGFSLLLFIRPRKMAYISFLVTIFFTIILILSHIFFGIEDCGCFGNVFQIPVSVAYIRNILLIVLSYSIWKYYPVSSNTKWVKARIAVVSIFAITAFSISISDLASAYSNAKQIRGINIRNTFLPSIAKLPESEKYLIFVFLPTCPHCQKAVVKLNNFKEKALVQDIVGIYPSYITNQELALFVNKFKVDFPVYPLGYDSIKTLTRARGYPVMLLIKNDTVVSNFNYYVPTPKELSQ